METGSPVILASDITSVRPWSLSSAAGSASYGTAFLAVTAAALGLAAAVRAAGCFSRRLAATRHRARPNRAAYTKIGVED